MTGDTQQHLIALIIKTRLATGDMAEVFAYNRYALHRPATASCHSH